MYKGSAEEQKIHTAAVRVGKLIYGLIENNCDSALEDLASFEETLSLVHDEVTEDMGQTSLLFKRRVAALRGFLDGISIT